MRWSRLFTPTLRENPGGVESTSHRLLLRAGYIRQLMSGHYSLLPLGIRVRHRLMQIIRQEMDRIGGQEFLCPAMHPAELWQRSGRWVTMGQEMFRLQDRRGGELALGMTHEEVFTALALELTSYRQLPQIWYQIQTKFRDEPRPKAGLLRTREFTMKDSYSFDLDEAGLDQSFDLHRDAYERIFSRMDIPFVPVKASSGAMGGSDSVEFMAPSEAGEDVTVRCRNCGYAANVEAAAAPSPAPMERPSSPPPETFPTPGVRTIEELANPPYGVPAARQIKTLVYVIDEQLTLVLLRGDHNLEEQKLVDRIGSTTLRPAHPDEIRAALGASPGSLGAVGLTDFPVVADTSLRGERDMTTGANRDDAHVRHVDLDRDITVSAWADLRRVEERDPCSRCGEPLTLQRAIEVGHIFKLGRKYTDTLEARVLDSDGRERTITMGSYGIGVERAMAAIVESHHDEKGIVWPLSVAPFEVVVVSLGGAEATTAAAQDIYQELLDAGIDVLLDDRTDTSGVKLKDSELVGIPYRLVIGPRGLESGTIDFTARRSGETTSLPLDKVANLATSTIVEARTVPTLV